VIFENLYFTR